MKRPFDSIKELFFENISKSSDNNKFVFEHSDKLIVWVVGFSIGGLSLIISNITSINQLIDHCVLKYILVLLTVSIITGILYRISFFFYQIKYKNIETYLEIAFSDKKIMNINPDDISNETDIKEVIRRINNDFGEDLSNIHELYEKSNEKVKAEFLENLQQHYIKTGEWAKNDYEEAIMFVKDKYKNAFGLNDKQINKLFNENTKLSSWLKIYGWTSIISFILSCLSFISVIIILCSNF